MFLFYILLLLISKYHQSYVNMLVNILTMSYQSLIFVICNFSNIMYENTNNLLRYCLFDKSVHWGTVRGDR